MNVFTKKKAEIIEFKRKPSAVLDNGVAYNQVDLLSHLPDSFLSKQLSKMMADACHLPPSSVFLNLIGIYSSISCRRWAVNYQNGTALNIGLYVVTEQPPGTGKSRCHSIAQKPFFELKAKARQNFMQRWEKLDKKDLSVDEQQEKDELSEKKSNVLSKLFLTNATPEAMEADLVNTNGFFAAISSEQGLFNSLLGLSYTNGGAANNDLLLNGFAGDFVANSRISREAFTGFVAGACVMFAQPGSIEKVIGASEGTGLADRFLMLSEPHRLGKRNHSRKAGWNADLIDAYEKKCNVLNDIFTEKQTCFADLYRLIISEAGWKLINDYRNSIEPHLADGEKYSHSSLRGAASKIDMQIMKIVAILYVLERDQNDSYEIDVEFVRIAINIANELLEASFELYKAKGIIGERAEYMAILRMFENNPNPKTERQIIQSRSCVLPFKDYSGNKSQRIRETLEGMVVAGLLFRMHDAAGPVTYHLND